MINLKNTMTNEHNAKRVYRRRESTIKLGSNWSGFDNFVYLFSSNDAFRILRNTILYNAAFIVIGTVAAVTLAILLDKIKSKGFTKFCQTSMFLPYFISWVIVGFIAQQVFALNNGLANHIIEMFGGKKYHGLRYQDRG